LDKIDRDLEGYFASLAEQGFQNNSFSRSSTKKWGLAPSSGALTFQIVIDDNKGMGIEQGQCRLFHWRRD